MNNIEEQKIIDHTRGGKADFGPAPGGGNSGKPNFGPAPSSGKPNFGPAPGGGNSGKPNFGPAPGGGGGANFGPAPGATADPFACLLKDTTNKLSTDKKTVVHTTSSGDIWTFYLDNKYTYKFKSGNVVNGTWECNGTDNYKVKTEDGDSYDSKTGKWAGVPSSGSGSGSNSGSTTTAPVFTDTSLTVDDLKAGKTVSKGMKGAVVGEIQKLLIAAGYKNISKSGRVDKIFGSRTKKSVEDFQTANQLKVDGIVGTETINALLKATPASSQSSSDSERKPFDPNAEEDNSIPSTDGALIKEKEKMLQESLKKMLRNSLLKYS